MADKKDSIELQDLKAADDKFNKPGASNRLPTWMYILMLGLAIGTKSV